MLSSPVSSFKPLQGAGQNLLQYTVKLHVCVYACFHGHVKYARNKNSSDFCICLLAAASRRTCWATSSPRKQLSPILQASRVHG